MTRPVHYASHGTSGLAFPCFYEELKRHLDSKVMVPAEGAMGSGYYRAAHPTWPVPAPRRSTDVNKVTCTDCLRGIRNMVTARLTQASRGGGDT